MPLAKVQLMAPPGGPGEVGAVKPGTNITISADGTISSSGGGGGGVTSVDASGGTTGLNFTGGPITSSGTLALGGVLAVANGGTGATSTAQLQANALPPQAGQSGNFLTTNGTAASWASVATSFNIASLPTLP